MKGRSRSLFSTAAVLAMTASLVLATLAPAGAEVCTEPAWDPGVEYQRHDRVSHAGHEWRARHPNQGEEPGVSSVWQNRGACEPADTDPPSAPANLTVTGTTATSVSLAWEASSGDVADYQVLVDGSAAATTQATTHTVTGLTPETTYTFAVQARDATGNPSEPSNEVTATTQPSDNGDVRDHVVVAYFTQWSIYRRDYLIRDVHESGQAAELTHINYAFANINDDGECFQVNQRGEGDAFADYGKVFSADESVDGVADSQDQALRGNFNQLRKLKQVHPGLKTLISIGGWTWSKNFSDAALTPESREQFVASCIDIFLRGNLPVISGYGGPGAGAGVFDGIDLDWEWPASEGHEHNTVRPEDRENFVELVKEFRRQLDEFEVESGREMLLTAFLPADPAKIEAGIAVDGVFEHFDYATVQGYDFHGAWDPITNHQANLFEGPGDPAPVPFSVDGTIQEYLARGAPPEKLVPGVPFYGRGWKGVGSTNDGLYQPANGPARGKHEHGIDDYKEIITKSGTRFYDEEVGAVWLYTGNQWWSYDDPPLVEQKAQYVIDNGLGGLMAWSLDGDDAQGSMTKAMGTLP